jgi:hypothetical protein
MLTMSRLTATLAAAAIALTGLTATPAVAQDRDLARFLAGAALVAIIATAASRNRAEAEAPRYDRRYGDNRRFGNDRRYGQHQRGHAWGRPAVLPAACSIQVRNRGRNELLYNPRCLERAGIHRLPRQCERELRTNRGSRTVLSGACLQQAGFRVEAGRRR